MKSEGSTDHDNALSSRSEDEIRDRARELNEQDWVIEVSENAKVIRRGDDETTLVEAWIHLGEDD